jgi:hypothetical protein
MLHSLHTTVGVYLCSVREKTGHPLGLEVIYVRDIAVSPAPLGFRWVFTRYRKVRNSARVLDAHDYGYRAWAFLVRT